MSGFSLLELLVVIGIITLLVAISIPAYSTLRNSAKSASTLATFNAIDNGLSAMLSERTFGGVYPWSSSDNTNGQVLDPLSDGSVKLSFVPGATFLHWGLVGADFQGTPGFQDLDGDGLWSNNQFGVTRQVIVPGLGAYEMYEDNLSLPQQLRGQPAHQRFGPYVDASKMKIRSYLELANEGTARFPDIPDNLARHSSFLDAWEHPILYYRANKGAPDRVRDRSPQSPPRAVYNHTDNVLLTGGIVGNNQVPGADYGAGGHAIASAFGQNPPPVSATYDQVVQGWPNMFVSFVLDKSGKSTGVGRPVRQDSYLLISAGQDGIYGSSDDIVNWDRE